MGSGRQLSAVLDRLLSPVLIVCAIVMTVLAARRELAPSRSASSRPAMPTAYIIGRLAPSMPRSAGGRIVGESAAPVRVLEFADFQCPFCARAAEELAKLAADNPRQIAVEFHHAVIPGHPFARLAAEAAECAADQDRFTEMYHLIFENGHRLGSWSWREFGRRAGVKDLVAFDRCVQEHKFSARIDADIELAGKLGVRGTPTWLVHDSLFGGLPPVAQLREWVLRD